MPKGQPLNTRPVAKRMGVFSAGGISGLLKGSSSSPPPLRVPTATSGQLALPRSPFYSPSYAVLQAAVMGLYLSLLRLHA